MSDKLRRRSTNRTKYTISVITVACIVLTTVAALLGVDYWRAKGQSGTKSVYPRADARNDQSQILKQIHERPERIGR